MTVQEIIEKEPRLQEVIEWLQSENRRAEYQTVHFWEVWPTLKRKMTPLVGWDARQPDIKESKHWIMMVQHFERMATNML
jgi:hypothetical protein